MPKNKQKKSPNLSDRGKQAHAARQQRRADFLRQNLVKRKSQQRIRSSIDADVGRDC